MGLWDWLTGRRRGSEHTEEVAPAPAPPTEAEVRAACAAVRDRARAEAVAWAVQSRVDRITGTVEQTLPRLRNFGLGSYEGYAVVATATSYLPEALENYLRLPRQWADSRPVSNGKSALLLLVDQLDLLAVTMDRFLDAAVRDDARALVEHGRFLDQKFTTAPGSLDLSGPGPSPTLEER